ncbi:extensin-like [Leptopilina heterotoma]|uniref:extensin-like n=1 Tax=Leptopilina heterotoma TaxID=63436 RepID=UPI001CA8AC80|nr:extensin-like [Leptopilina heterotoma]
MENQRCECFNCLMRMVSQYNLQHPGQEVPLPGTPSPRPRSSTPPRYLWHRPETPPPYVVLGTPPESREASPTPSPRPRSPKPPRYLWHRPETPPPYVVLGTPPESREVSPTPSPRLRSPTPPRYPWQRPETPPPPEDQRTASPRAPTPPHGGRRERRRRRPRVVIKIIVI